MALPPYLDLRGPYSPAPPAGDSTTTTPHGFRNVGDVPLLVVAVHESPTLIQGAPRPGARLATGRVMAPAHDDQVCSEDGARHCEQRYANELQSC